MADTVRAASMTVNGTSVTWMTGMGMSILQRAEKRA